MLAHGIEAIRKHLAELPDSSTLEIPARRKMYNAAERIFQLPADVEAREVDCNGQTGEVLTPSGDNQRALLYLHGGGYVLGSPKSHRHMIAGLAKAAN